MVCTREELMGMLMKLEKELLAEALADMWLLSNESFGVIDRLVSSPAERRERIIRAVSWFSERIKASDVPDYEICKFTIEQIIKNIRRDIEDPVEGIRLLEKLFETDEKVLTHFGEYETEVLGDLYAGNAGALFAEFAERSGDMDFISDVIFRLYRDKTYPADDMLCARAVLVDYAEDLMKPTDYEELIGRIRSVDPDYGEFRLINIENLVRNLECDYARDPDIDPVPEDGEMPYDD